jgi:hypothetical protein
MYPQLHLQRHVNLGGVVPVCLYQDVSRLLLASDLCDLLFNHVTLLRLQLILTPSPRSQ